MHAAFDASPEFDHNPLKTAEEIERCGDEVLEWLTAEAESNDPAPVDVQLVNDIHRRWFETTFPADAGRHRTALVKNRKGTAVAVPAILPAVDGACGNWNWRREKFMPADPLEQMEFFVAEANSLVIAIYDAHPFIDGNTRTTWHLRNYLHMIDGLRPLIDLSDQDAYEQAWWASTPHEHVDLDRFMLEELASQDR